MKLARFAALALGAAFSIAATSPQAAPAKARNWNQAVAVTPSGSHVQGNPDAQVKLVEFVSYTCPHCASFEKQSATALRVGYVASGKVSVEVRHLLRDPIDMTVALLTNCGEPSRFFGNHTMFLQAQDKWIPRMAGTGSTFRERWTTGDFATRMRAVASDFGFYPMMEARGYDRPTIDRCLADQPKAQRLAQMTQDALEAGVQGTPSFTIDGRLTDIHEWRALEAALQDKLKRS